MRYRGRRSTLGLVALLLLSSLALLLAAGTANAQGAQGSILVGSQCRVVGSPSQLPSWTASGVWNRKDLVLVDTGQRALLRYSTDGRLLERPSGPLSRSWSDLYPARIAAREDGHLVVEVEPNVFFILDRSYRFVRRVDPLAFPSRNGTVDKVYTWGVAGADVVAFADLKDPSGQWPSGIVRFSLDSEQSNRGIEFHEFGDISRKFHRLGYSYVTAIGNTAYIVLMENGFSLWRYEKGRGLEEMEVLRALYPLSEPAPALPSFRSRTDYVLLMRELEEISMPTGIYSWRGSPYLYLLSRRPHPSRNGGTQWRLSQIDPNYNNGQGRIVGTVEIPSRANHLFAVPGPENWAFVEKGPVLGLTEQDVQSVLTISSPSLLRAFSRAAERLGGQSLVNACQ